MKKLRSIPLSCLTTWGSESTDNVLFASNEVQKVQGRSAAWQKMLPPPHNYVMCPLYNIYGICILYIHMYIVVYNTYVFLVHDKYTNTHIQKHTRSCHSRYLNYIHAYDLYDYRNAYDCICSSRYIVIHSKYLHE